MARSTIRKSPVRTRPVFKYLHSPFSAKSPLNPNGGTPRSAAKKRLLAPSNRSKLTPILEKSPTMGFIQGTSTPHRQAHDALTLINSTSRRFVIDGAMADDNADSEQSSDFDSDFEGWDDETTLVSKFQENPPELSEHERLEALANSLEGPMQVNAAALKQYLAHTIAPAARKVKEVHEKYEQSVDVAFGIGVLSFDDTCKRIEKMALKDEDEIKTAFLKTQRTVKNLLHQLDEAYQRRDELWVKLKEAIEDSASRALEALTALPSELESTISEIEKKAKEVTKGSGLDGKARQKLLREILAVDM